VTTENVAILFTDIVGSTELSQRLSADAADEVRRGHVSILRQAIAEAGGTEVKNLGDGLMVVFGSASAAMACAVAMQQGVERGNRDREHSVGLRVGLSGGEVSREDDDYFGDPVIEAARLCATCESGQVLAADIVRLTAGRRSRHQCNSLGERILKGLPDAIETVEVLWEPLGGLAAGGVPLPVPLARRPTVGVIGREAEMQRSRQPCSSATGAVLRAPAWTAWLTTSSGSSTTSRVLPVVPPMACGLKRCTASSASVTQNLAAPTASWATMSSPSPTQ
jgi:class 3 adenylate cyclase